MGSTPEHVAVGSRCRSGAGLVLVSIYALCASACGEPTTDTTPSGGTGYISDQAREIHTSIHRTIRVLPCSLGSIPGASPCDDLGHEVLDELLTYEQSMFDADGVHLGLSQASISWRLLGARDCGIACEATVEIDVWSLIQQRDERYGIVPLEAFSHLEATRERSRASPDFAALRADGELSITLVFSQIDPDGLESTDPGFLAQERVAAALVAEGFDQTVREGVHKYSVDREELRVVVSLLGPDRFPIGDDPEQASVLSQHMAASDITYINGHASQKMLDAIVNEDSYSQMEYQILILDVCWSYFRNVSPALEAASRLGTRLDVVSAAGRVITGSEESSWELWARILQACTRAPLADDAAPPTWLTLIREMNALARHRVVERGVHVDRRGLRDPESYGVSSRRWE